MLMRAKDAYYHQKLGPFFFSTFQKLCCIKQRHPFVLYAWLVFTSVTIVYILCLVVKASLNDSAGELQLTKQFAANQKEELMDLYLNRNRPQFDMVVQASEFGLSCAFIYYIPD